VPYDFVQVDVFTNEPLYGNPAEVVFDADALDAVTMQRIAREMNLSETVFILNPTSAAADYRARIFTPMSELNCAGFVGDRRVWRYAARAESARFRL
jgi:PhzF family phenazine biosynthesis protein